MFGFSEGRFGAHAEYLTMPEDGSLATMPANVTYEEAAASTEGSHYALSMITKAKIRSGQHVLVNGATGAIGSAAVQLLKRLGAVVTAVCATEHVELVRGLGADRVIDYTAEDFTKDAQTYDVVLDAVGKSSFGRCKRLLKPRGIYVSSDLGPWAQNPILALVTPLFGGKKVMFPIPPKYDRALVRGFKEMIESGEFTPVIDRRYPLDQIVEAYRYVETGQKIGNVVINVEPSPHDLSLCAKVSRRSVDDAFVTHEDGPVHWMRGYRSSGVALRTRIERTEVGGFDSQDHRCRVRRRITDGACSRPRPTRCRRMVRI